MSDLKMQIDLSNHTGAYAPGARVQGRVTIASADGPWETNSIDLILFWRTSGIGTKDEGIAQTVQLAKKDEKIPSHFSHDFNLTLPYHPYTYYGQLIKITWHLGLYVKKGWLNNQEIELLLEMQPGAHTNVPIDNGTIFYDNHGNALPNQPIM